MQGIVHVLLPEQGVVHVLLPVQGLVKGLVKGLVLGLVISIKVRVSEKKVVVRSVIGGWCAGLGLLVVRLIGKLYQYYTTT